MGIRGKFFIVAALIAVVVGGSSFYLINRSHNELIEMDAERIASIISTQVALDRSVYTGEVLEKLKKDGTGASKDYTNMPGYIPLPAQFISSVSKKVQAREGKLYTYGLRSKWNLNQEQGLNDNFDKWAWAELEKQDQIFTKEGPPKDNSGYSWQPIYKIERNESGAQVLRYMSADPASAEACVTCHNTAEKDPNVIKMRTANGVEAGKQWKLHQLMGAVKVEIPLNEVARSAERDRSRLMSTLAITFFFGFGFLFLMIFQFIITPLEKSVNEVEKFSEKVDNMLQHSRQLIRVADSQVTLCNEAKGSDPNSMDVIVSEISQMALQNSMKVEDTAAICQDLDSSFKELKSRLAKIIGK